MSSSRTAGLSPVPKPPIATPEMSLRSAIPAAWRLRSSGKDPPWMQANSCVLAAPPLTYTQHHVSLVLTG